MQGGLHELVLPLNVANQVDGNRASIHQASEAGASSEWQLIKQGCNHSSGTKHNGETQRKP
jgi:hypothetical protein